MAMNPYVKGYQYGACRLLGHMWHVVPSDWTPTFGVPMTVRCERCDIERRDTVNRSSGEVQSRRYTYPVGYNFRHEDGLELPRRQDFRVAWLEGVINEGRKSRHQAREEAAR